MIRKEVKKHLLIEITTASNRHNDEKKTQQFADSGVEYYMIVDRGLGTIDRRRTKPKVRLGKLQGDAGNRSYSFTEYKDNDTVSCPPLFTKGGLTAKSIVEATQWDAELQ